MSYAQEGLFVSLFDHQGRQIASGYASFSDDIRRAYETAKIRWKNLFYADGTPLLYCTAKKMCIVLKLSGAELQVVAPTRGLAPRSERCEYTSSIASIISDYDLRHGAPWL